VLNGDAFIEEQESPLTMTTISSRGRVLVVDDEAACCLALEMLLTDEGFQVDVAHDGAQALERMAESPPDVLLSDIRMPGMDGLALLRAVRATGDLPVILMSADSGVDDAELRRMGATGYVVKPLDFDDVIRAIDDALVGRPPPG